MIIEKLETMENKSTGSTFYVVGETEKLKFGLRVWQDNWASVPFGVAALLFRVRVEAKPGNPLDIKTLADFELGPMDWAGGSGQHLSKAGYMEMHFPHGGSTADYLNFVKNIGAMESLYTELCKQYLNVKWLISLEAFVIHFTELLKESQPKAAPGAQVPFALNWGNGKAPTEVAGASQHGHH